MDDIIKATVLPIVPVCVPNIYAGEATEYCVYNYTEVPDNFGDDAPQGARYLIQVHWYFPFVQNVSATADVKAKKNAIQRALADADMTWPTITPAGDSVLEHYVFECEYVGEV